MQCQEFEYRLNAVLDERGDPERDLRLAAHAQSCDTCRQLLAGQRALFAGLRQFAAPSLGPGFSQRVVAKAVAETPVIVRRGSRPVWLAVGALLASAAAALMAVSLVWYARRGGPAMVNSSYRQPRPVVVNVGPAPQSPARNQRGRGGGPIAYGGLAIAQPGWLIEAPRLPGHLQNSIDSLPESFPETMDQLNQVEHLAPGIRPIRLSLSALWDALCHVFPGGQAEPTPPTRGRTSSWWLDKLQLA